MNAALCSKRLHRMTDANTILEYERSRSRVNKRCRACKYAYEAARKRFKRANPGQRFDPTWKSPKRRCKRGHPMTPKNTRLVGRRGDKRCNKCYMEYRRRYQREWQLWRIYRDKAVNKRRGYLNPSP